MARITFKQQAIAIHEKMKEPTERQKMAILYRTLPAHRVSRSWRRKSISYCSECGNQIHNPSLKECPHCGVKLKGETVPHTANDSAYHMIMEAVGDIQVCRYFYVRRYTHYGRKTNYLISEVERIMYAPSGERKVFARPIQGMSWYFDAWCFFSNMRLTKECEVNHCEQQSDANRRNNLDVWTYHIKSLTQQWKYKRVEELMAKWKNDTSVLRVIAYPWGEMLLKTGQTKLFDYLVNYYHKLPKGCEKSVNICNRNHYVISDPSMWLDHWKCLHDLKLDTRNAHYVAPADLTAAHNKFLPRWNRIKRERRAVMMERAERAYQTRRARADANYAAYLESLKEEEAKYPERMGVVLTLTLGAENLCIRPLQTVDEFREEGKAMHHCVGSAANYWKKADTLILSAKDGEGKRLATIEYNTQRHDIVQCRAACNAVPERDKEIRQLITDHRKDIEALLRRKEISTKATKKQKKQTAAVAA